MCDDMRCNGAVYVRDSVQAVQVLAAAPPPSKTIVLYKHYCLTHAVAYEIHSTLGGRDRFYRGNCEVAVDGTVLKREGRAV